MKLFFGLFLGFLPVVATTWISPSIAEGGCPDGLFPVGGGYCRNIVCIKSGFGGQYGQIVTGDASAQGTLEKYNRECPMYHAVRWGDMMVPKR
jgi:hypothetical protein